MDSEISGLYEANNELRDELRRLRQDDRERRNEIIATMDANIRSIAELKAERAGNRAQMRELYEQLDGLKEANRQLRDERGRIHPDDREGRNSLRDTIDRNSEEISRIYAEIARLRGS